MSDGKSKSEKELIRMGQLDIALIKGAEAAAAYLHAFGDVANSIAASADIHEAPTKKKWIEVSADTRKAAGAVYCIITSSQDVLETLEQAVEWAERQPRTGAKEIPWLANAKRMISSALNREEGSK